jgi:hypothetical protein
MFRVVFGILVVWRIPHTKVLSPPDFSLESLFWCSWHDAASVMTVAVLLMVASVFSRKQPRTAPCITQLLVYQIPKEKHLRTNQYIPLI